MNTDCTGRGNRDLITAAVFIGIAGVSTFLWLRSPTPVHLEEAPEAAPAPSVAAPKPRPVAALHPAKVAAASEDTSSSLSLEEHWGIEVSSLRLSMGNSIIDLRYKILDPAKVVQLANNKTPSYIIDQASGKKLMMPTPPKEGAFPPTGNKLVAGKTYFAMVSNQGATLRSGSRVTVMVGGSEATNLTVQ